ncbi:MAG: mechanosensitive ion channel [Gemmatimonadetes bacterium]|nr:mechanosensitive ion channel [Gemmatimonadota bacterium]MBT5146617.1 mechanosensitive ion channel [Gemmatimonadota bacterium]MBT5587226.1 mechanosensitive ion channel [Gemmatimonadota bacterium]MBT5964811.1 mechanosensitive ion channel [Gemmatimonadota bacterium]MBT6628227.1 mechanosensitive ion channel [Gemmatimonadota bacterium]
MTAWFVRLIAVLALAALSNIVTRQVLVRWIGGLIRTTRTKADDVLLQRNVLRRMALLAPVIVLYYGADALPGDLEMVRQVVSAALLLVLLMVTGAVINAFQDLSGDFASASEVPIKSYAQIVKLVVYILGGLMTVAVLTGRSPWVLMSGIGALMAVIILVFRDTILNIVASITITANRLVRVGDWIEAPAFGADGDVIDIALHTVKVQNWDKTITTIPTYKLVETSFKNWRGMSESGGRRIKRALYIDMSTIRLCDVQMLERFERFELLAEGIRQRRAEVERYNAEHVTEAQELINGRRLTNVGTLRAYIIAYLRQHPNIHQDLTFLVRQLAPTPQGLPIEIYVFTRDIEWVKYEEIQADIFDHLLAVVPMFELRIFQEPTGADFTALRESP